jgi:hypothetical protein
MPAKIARLATRPPFWIPEVSVAVRSSRPSCSNAEKREYSWQIGSHPGNPGLEQTVKLVGQMKATAEGKGDFSEIVMPNGRKLSSAPSDISQKLARRWKLWGSLPPETSEIMEPH